MYAGAHNNLCIVPVAGASPVIDKASVSQQGITVEPSIAPQVESSTFSLNAEMVSIHSQGKYSTTDDNMAMIDGVLDYSTSERRCLQLPKSSDVALVLRNGRFARADARTCPNLWLLMVLITRQRWCTATAQSYGQWLIGIGQKLDLENGVRNVIYGNGKVRIARLLGKPVSARFVCSTQCAYCHKQR